MVTLDDAGQVVRPAKLWNDTESAPDAEWLLKQLDGGSAAWAEACGSVPVAAFTITKLSWLHRKEPDNWSRVSKVLLPHDWLTSRLTGRLTTDRGDASGTGYWSPVTGAYRPDLLERAFGRVVGTPRVAAPSEVVGETDGGLLVAAGTGDNMAAALGLGIAPGDVVVSLGTSGAVFGEHPRPVFDTGGDVASFASATGDHLPLMCTLNAARVLTATAQLLGTDLAGLDALALAAEPGAGGLTLLPYLDGERTPNLPDATGTLGGLTRANATPQNLARASVEGMLCNLAAGVGSLTRLGVQARRVLLIGGASASAAVREVAAMVFGVPVVVPRAGEYVAVGAARQAAWALRGGDAPPPWPVGAEAESDPHPGPEGSAVTSRYAALLRTGHAR
jgi:xylulokinase